MVGKEEEIRGGRIGRLCLSPRAQLRQHHGDRCLHSPQFEQCPAVLGHTVHSFALFHVARHPLFALLLAVSVLLLERHSRNFLAKWMLYERKGCEPILIIPAVTAKNGKEARMRVRKSVGLENGGRWEPRWDETYRSSRESLHNRREVPASLSPFSPNAS